MAGAVFDGEADCCGIRPDARMILRRISGESRRHQKDTTTFMGSSLEGHQGAGNGATRTGGGDAAVNATYPAQSRGGRLASWLSVRCA